MEPFFEEAQCGFRPDNSTQDLIFTLRKICEKGTEYNKKVYFYFSSTDFVKTLDRVPWAVN